MAESYSVEAVLSLVDAGYKKGMEDAAKAAEDMGETSEKAGSSTVKSFAAAQVAVQAVEKAMAAVTSNIGNAVDRLDALNNFPKVMSTLGYSTDLANEKIQYLAEVTDALPTTLSEIVSSTQTLTASLNDLDKGTDTAVALNDMFLAGGQGADAASRAMTQYNQILAKGKVDQQSWNTLVEVAPGQMNQLAQSLLGATAGQKDLYQALQAGTISVEEMNDAVITLDQEGGDSFASFHDQALGATGGIGTAWTNLQNQVVKGTADIIDNMDKAAQAAGMPGLAESIDIVRGHIGDFFDDVSDVAGAMVTEIAPAAKLVENNFGLIATVAGEVTAAVVTMKVIKKVSGWFDDTKKSISDASKTMKAYEAALSTYGDKVNATTQAEKLRQQATEANAAADKAVATAIKSRAEAERAAASATQAKVTADREEAKTAELVTTAEEKALAAEEASAKADADLAAAKEAKILASEANAAATEAEAAAETLSNSQISVKTALLGVLSGEYTVVEAGQLAWNAAMAANPIGLIITGATALVSVITILADKFGGLSEEEEEAAAAEEEFHQACADAVDTENESADALEQVSAEAKANSEKIDDLVNSYKKLSSKEKRSASDKEELAGVVEELNSNIDGLNLAYDEESDHLSMTTDMLEKKADAYKKQSEATAIEEEYNSALEREQDLLDQQYEAQTKLSDAKDTLAEKEAAYNKAIEENSATIDLAKDAYFAAQDAVNQYQTDLDNVNTALETNKQAQSDYAAQVAASSSAAADAESAAADETVTALANAIVGKQELLAQAIADHSATLDQLSEKNQETVENLQETWQGYYDTATDMFSKLDTSCSQSVDDMIANLQANQSALTDWGNNMQSLRDRVESMDVPAPVREGLQEMLEDLQAAGPEQAGAVAEIANATDEQLTLMGESWSTASDTAWNSMQNSMSTKAAETSEQVKYLVTDITDSLSETLEGTDWSELGSDAVDGLAEGLEADDAAVEAAKQLAEDTLDGSKEGFDSHSPSRKYDSLGQDCDQGLANGFTKSTSTVVSASKSVATAAINSARSGLSSASTVGSQAVHSLASGMYSASSSAYSAGYSVGSFAGQGMYNGLASQQGSITSLASSIASSVSSTISSTLKIGSPSKVTRKEGMWTGKGFGLGVEDEIPFVQRIVDKMSAVAAGISIPSFSAAAGELFSGTIHGTYSYTVDSIKEELENLKDAIFTQPVVVNSKIDMDGRTIGNGVAVYVKDRNDYNTKLQTTLQGAWA